MYRPIFQTVWNFVIVCIGREPALDLVLTKAKKITAIFI